MTESDVKGYSSELFSRFRESQGGEGVFICYRTQDTAGHAGRIHDRMSENFGSRKVFFDQTGMNSGDSITKKTVDIMEKCSAVVVLIGPNWIRHTDAHDYVIAEIEEAISKDKLIVPVLLDNTEMPKDVDLPERIKELSDRVAINLRNSHFDDDFSELIAVLKSNNINRGMCLLEIVRKK